MSVDDDNPLPVIGYSDRLSIQPGETVRFMVSCDFDRYGAEIVRLIHADDNPIGPGLKEEPLATPVSAEHEGRKYRYDQGSYVVVPAHDVLRSLKSFSLQAWIYPTTPAKGVQGIITVWNGSGAGSGIGLFLDAKGCLALALRDGKGVEKWISTGKPLHGARWYFVACSYDDTRGKVTLVQEVVATCHLGEGTASVNRVVQPDTVGPLDESLLIGACWDGAGSRTGRRVSGHYNGKIDRPRVFSRALDAAELRSLKAGAAPEALGRDLAAAWDMSRAVHTDAVFDVSTHAMHGKAVNAPKRAVTGYNWTGRELDFRRAPAEYGAIHFHDDDLDDCGWEAGFEFTAPKGLRSGVYAAKLQAGGHTDYVPFFVRPPRGKTTAKIAFLVPTLTYLAYADDHFIGNPELQRINQMPEGFAYPVRDIDRYLMKTNLLSLYDRHTDGSGVCYASRLRPMLTMRPEYREVVQAEGKGAPHLLPADLWLTDWMEAKGFKYDVLTDEDLHREGLSAIEGYSVVVTGTHPEYWTDDMLGALERYLNGGGRFMYMGGNGLYWVTSIDPERPHMIEVRRWGGTQAWRSEPGEFYHSSTGEMGGLWRNRNRAPQKMVGVGFTAQGHARNMPYRRLPGSYDPKAEFIFKGIGKDEVIGDFACLDQGYGAAGYEFDRFDRALGTPDHALLLATANGFSDGYQHVSEEIDSSDSMQGGTVNEKVRADMVYLEYPNGGAVFSTGSVTWSGCLFYNGYENNVSRITQNVLRRFSASEKKTP